MIKIVYLHIGTEKTGSTSIQAFLTQNRDGLREKGFLYPACFELPTQSGLAAYAGNREGLKNLATRFGLETAQRHERFRADLEQKFADEIAAAHVDDGVLLLSSEHLHSRIENEEEVGRLRDLLARHCREVRVIVYLRRQDRFAVSMASTYYKVGRTTPWKLPAASSAPDVYDYAALVERYAAVFGKQNLIVRLFEPKLLKSGDVVADFNEITGVPTWPGMKQPPRQNESVTNLGIDVLSGLSKRIRQGGQNSDADTLWNELVGVVANSYAGKPSLITRQEARSFYERFAAGNARVRAEYLPALERETLFDEDFSAYPEALMTETRNFADGCDAAATLWMDRAETLNRQRAHQRRQSLAIEAALQHLTMLSAELVGSANARPTRSLAAAFHELGDTDRALQTIRRAVAAAPDDAIARLLFGRILVQKGHLVVAIPELLAAIEAKVEPEAATLELVNIYRRLRRTDDAFDLLETAVQAYPSNRELRVLRTEMEGARKRAPGPARASA